MKKFNFRLQRVLEVREAKETACQRDLARSVEELRREELRLQEAGSELEASSEGLRLALKKSDSAGNLVALDSWRIRKGEELKMQKARTRDRKNRVQQKRSTLIQASKDRKVLDRLRRRRMEEHEAESRAEEQAFMDELGSRTGRTRRPTNYDFDGEE